MPRRRCHFIGGGGGGAAPTLGTPVVKDDGTNWTSLTFSGAFTPATGDVLIMALGRSNSGGTFTSPTATLGGITAVRRHLILPSSINSGDALIGIWTVRDVATGGALGLTLNWDNEAGNTLVFLADIIGWGGSVGGVGGSIYDSASAASSHAGSLATAGTGRLIVGIAGGASGNLEPITASGWGSALATGHTGGGNVGTDSSAALFKKTGGAIGTTETLTGAMSASHTDLGVGLIELL